METFFIIALLASNLWLMSKVFKKPDNATPQKPTQVPSSEVAEATPVSDEKPDDGQPNDLIVGESKLDMEKVEEIILRMVKKTVPLVITEYTKVSDVKFADELEDTPVTGTPTAVESKENLDEMFTHATVDDITGEVSEAAPPREGGHDFMELEAAVRVAKNEPHTIEEAKNSTVVLTDIQGTELEKRITLDPKVRQRLMAIVYGNPGEKLTEESLKDKKVVFSATVDTFDVDSININILT